MKKQPVFIKFGGAPRCLAVQLLMNNLYLFVISNPTLKIHCECNAKLTFPAHEVLSVILIKVVQHQFKGYLVGKLLQGGSSIGYLLYKKQIWSRLGKNFQANGSAVLVT